MQIASDSKPIPSKIQAKMEQYRTELLAFGMQEPSKQKSEAWHWYFFKPITELTAFIVNLTGEDKYIKAVYGYASTAFTRFTGDENALIGWGVTDADITIREKFIICDDADEKTARSLIADMYNQYLQTQKDDLLTFAREKRKAFIKHIALKLKALGFKKKANTWKRALDGEYYLMFNAQKSSFSDEYYFNVSIGKNGTDKYGDCYETRLAPQGMYPMDWQALSYEEFEFFLNNTVIPALEEIISTPLTELGKKQSYWLGCSCDRKECHCCWMQKNIWEAKEHPVPEEAWKNE